MGILSKLAFWKKKDEFSDIGKDLGLDKDVGMGSEANNDFGLGFETTKADKYPSFQQPQQPSNFSQPQNLQYSYAPPSYPQQYQDQNYVTTKNLEVISSKLDALRASLDSVNQRLANIESIARGEQEEGRKKRYY